MLLPCTTTSLTRMHLPNARGATNRYCPTVAEAVLACPPGMVFVVGVSGNIAEKTGDKMKDYNDAALLAKEAARAYASGSGHAISPPHLANAVRDAGGDGDVVRKAISAHFAAGGTTGR